MVMEVFWLIAVMGSSSRRIDQGDLRKLFGVSLESSSPMESHPLAVKCDLSRAEHVSIVTQYSKKSIVARIVLSGMNYKSSRLVDIKLPQRRRKPMMVRIGSSINISMARDTIFSLE